MAVKVKVNRASLRLDNVVARQIAGSSKKTQQLLNGFKNSSLPEQWAGMVEVQLKYLHDTLVAVFAGEVTSPQRTVNRVFGVDLAKPWQPLSASYLRSKNTNSFWHESGELLNYVSSALRPLSSSGSVRKVEVKAGKFARGAKSLRVSVLVTPARLPEPMQSLVMYPFLQGRGNDLSGIGAEADFQAYKLLVNQAVRGFVPEVSAEFGKQLLDELRSL